MLFIMISLSLVRASLTSERRIFHNFMDEISCEKIHPNESLPAIALSPARYNQMLALSKYLKGITECDFDETSSNNFEMYDPNTWPFCASGSCRNNRCVCSKNFTGTTCGVYRGTCELIGCYLLRCTHNFEDLSCVALPEGITKTSSGLWWYDDKLEHSYRENDHRRIYFDQPKKSVGHYYYKSSKVGYNLQDYFKKAPVAGMSVEELIAQGNKKKHKSKVFEDPLEENYFVDLSSEDDFKKLPSSIVTGYNTEMPIEFYRFESTSLNNCVIFEAIETSSSNRPSVGKLKIQILMLFFLLLHGLLHDKH